MESQRNPIQRKLICAWSDKKFSFFVTFYAKCCQTEYINKNMPQQHSDYYYIDSVLSGNRNDYKYLVERHSGMSYSVALKIVKNETEAEEIVQEAFIKAYNVLHTFKKKSKFSTWLYRIVYNMAINHSNSRVHKNLYDDNSEIKDNLLYEETELMEIDENEQTIEKLNWAVKQLPEDEQVIITLFYNDDISIADIAKITNLSEANVKVKLHRMRKKLYQLMTTE